MAATPTVSPAGAGSVSLIETGAYTYYNQNGNAFDGVVPRYQATPASGYRFSHWLYDATYAETDKDTGAVERCDTDTDRTAYNTTFNAAGSPGAFGVWDTFDWNDNESEDESWATRSLVHQTNTVTRIVAVFVPSSQYKLTLSASPSDGGTVTGGGFYNPGTLVTVTATPASGYHFVSWSDGGAQTHQVTLNSDLTLVATFAIANVTITVVASPSNYGTVTGGGTYAVGETCTVTATVGTVSGKRIAFGSWSDGGAQAHSFVVTEAVTLTAYFVESSEILIGCYSRNAAWYRKSPYTVTMSCNGQSVTWDANASDSAYLTSDPLVVPIGSTVTLTTSIKSAEVPSCMAYAFGGYYDYDETTKVRTLRTASASATFTANKNREWVLPAYTATLRCQLELYHLATFAASYPSSTQPTTTRITDLSDIPDPEVVTATGDTVTLVKQSDAYTFDLEWDPTVLYPLVSPITPGFQSATEFKVSIKPVKIAEHRVELAALQVASDDLDYGVDDNGDPAYQVGVLDFADYKDLTPPTPFVYAYTQFDGKAPKSGVTASRAIVKGYYGGGPSVRWRITASPTRTIANTLSSTLTIQLFDLIAEEWIQQTLGMVDTFVMAESDGLYFAFPGGGFYLSSSYLRYAGGTTADSLYVRYLKNTVAMANSTVARGSGSGKSSNIASAVRFQNFQATDALEIRMHVGTFNPLHPGINTLLTSAAGNILIDS